MAERGNTTHGQNLDDQMKHETQGWCKETNLPMRRNGAKQSPSPMKQTRSRCRKP